MCRQQTAASGSRLGSSWQVVAEFRHVRKPKLVLAVPEGGGSTVAGVTHAEGDIRRAGSASGGQVRHTQQVEA